ncbi:hypothetical protein [Peribacillus loiseleuriae]|uniref:hypothetical protein n=1 Tax=Peribacillus loiseleuriae TaxID=1679170 RepID=UPI003D01217D
MTIKALIFNCILKRSSEKSNTLALVEEVPTLFNGKDIETEILNKHGLLKWNFFGMDLFLMRLKVSFL